MKTILSILLMLAVLGNVSAFAKGGSGKGGWGHSSHSGAGKHYKY